MWGGLTWNDYSMAMDKLDDLLLLERLAAGGMAEVYRAIQQGYGGFEKVVAVKRILPHFASDEEFKNMFVMEANLSGLLQHPNIVQIFSNGESQGYLYLVMEFVDGKNVRQLLSRSEKQKRRIPIEYSCYIIAEAAKGLDYAHSFVDEKTGQEMEIVHRDMSPQNIMLSYDGAVKIVDFGIAKAAARSEHTRAGVLKGKFGYMSPEQAQGMPVDRRTDIFALGIIFFELLTQRRLFSHDDDMRTLQLIRECNVPRPSKYNPSISPVLDRIVRKALAKNRSDRYATAGELYADLQRFLNQKYPQFLPMEFSKFLKEKVFNEDIETEKKKRELLAAEAPAKLGVPGMGRKNAEALKKKEDRDKEATQVDFENEVSRITQASEIRDIGVLSKPEDGVSIENEQEVALAVEADFSEKPKPKASAIRRELVNSVQEQSSIEVSEVDRPSSELDPPGDLASEKTRITKSEIAADSELKSSDSDAAFPITSGPSHLSLSVQLDSNDGPAQGMKVKTLASPAQPLGVPQMRAPSALKIAKATPKLEETKEDPSVVKVGNKTIVYSHVTSLPSIFRSRIFILVMASAALGAYYHFQNSASQDVAVAVLQPNNPKKSEDGPSTQLASDQQSATSSKPEESRTPASADIDAPVYSPQGATGYLNVKSFPSATKIYVDGQLLVDAEGNPVRSPANLQKIQVGLQRIRLENSALGVSWEGEVQIEFDSVKKLEVRLK